MPRYSSCDGWSGFATCHDISPVVLVRAGPGRPLESWRLSLWGDATSELRRRYDLEFREGAERDAVGTTRE